jgi:hypothetical protein
MGEIRASSSLVIVSPLARHCSMIRDICTVFHTNAAFDSREVNARIASGENEHFEIKRRGAQSRWTLKYPRNTEPVNAPFFDSLKQIDIGRVLHFVAQHCPFMGAFDHVLGRYTKQEIDPHTS